MRININLLAYAATLTLLVACGKNSPVPTPTPGPDPQPENKEVIDSGKSAVTVKAVDSGYDLSYDSWVKIRTTQGTQTKDETFSATVVTQVRTPKAEALVDSWLGIDGLEWTSSSTSSEKELTPEGPIQRKEVVTSYKVESSIGSLCYELRSISLVYDDGEVRQEMPGYQFEELSDLGSNIEIADSFERDGKAYAYRKLTNGLKVKFGETLTLTGQLDLLRPISNEGGKYLLKSEIIRKEFLVIEETLVAEIITENRWSNGEVNQAGNLQSTYLGDNSNIHLETVIKAAGPDDIRCELKSCILKSSSEEYYPDDDEGEWTRAIARDDVFTVDLGYFVVDLTFARKNFVFDNGVLQERLTDFSFDPSTAAVEYWYNTRNGYVSFYVSLLLGGRKVESNVYCKVEFE